MVAPDDNRSADDPAPYKIVDGQAESCALTVAEPADPGWQSLERDPFAREANPAAEGRVTREHVEREIVRRRNVGRVPGERCPAERPFANAEERPDVLRHEAGNLKGVRYARCQRLTAD